MKNLIISLIIRFTCNEGYNKWLQPFPRIHCTPVTKGFFKMINLKKVLGFPGPVTN